MISKICYNYFLILYSIIPISFLFGPSISLINILVIDLSFILLILYKKNFSFLKSKPIKLLFLLYIYLIFNSFISLNSDLGFYRNLGFVRLIILFISINYFFNEKNFFNKVFLIWSCVFFLISFDVYLEGITGKNILGYGSEIGKDKYGQRIVSFFIDEPIVGGFINAFLLIIVGFFSDKLNLKYKNLILFSSFIFILAILITGERSNTLKAIFALIFFLLVVRNFSIKSKINSIILLSLIITISILNSDFLKLRFLTQIKNSLNYEKNIYFQLQKSGFEVFKNYKIFGVGNKNYRFETCNNNSNLKNVNYICTTHPHQTYLEFLSEHGIFGTTVILLIFYLLIFSKFKLFFKSYKNIQLGTFMYLLFAFSPFLPSGSFFSDYSITLFFINMSIFYASSAELNIFDNSKFKKKSIMNK